MTLTLRSSGELHQRCRLAWKLKMGSNMATQKLTRNSTLSHYTKQLLQVHVQGTPLTKQATSCFMIPSLFRMDILAATPSAILATMHRVWNQAKVQLLYKLHLHTMSSSCVQHFQQEHPCHHRQLHEDAVAINTASLSDWQLPEWWEVVHQTHVFMHAQENSCMCKISPGFGSTFTLEWSDTTTTIIKHDIHCRHTTTRFSNGTEGTDITMMMMMMSWCLMSSDVIWHVRDKLWPMPKHGSIILYVHGNQKAR